MTAYTWNGWRINDRGVIDIPSGVAPGYPSVDNTDEEES